MKSKITLANLLHAVAYFCVSVRCLGEPSTKRTPIFRPLSQRLPVKMAIFIGWADAPGGRMSGGGSFILFSSVARRAASSLCCDGTGRSKQMCVDMAVLLSG